MSVLITDAEREEYRAALQQIDDLIKPVQKHIAGSQKLDPAIYQVLTRMTDTSDPGNQLVALESLYDELDKQYDELLRYAAQFRFSPFCEYLYRNEPPAQHQEFLIQYMERIYNGELKRLAISMPPGAAKSSYASQRFPAWYLGQRPHHRWVQGAHTQTFAKDRLGKVVRGIIQDPRYKDVFPEMGLSASSSAADYFEFTRSTKGYYKAVGVGTGIAGFRFEIGAIDDPIASRQDAESPTLRKTLHDWYDDDFGTRGSNPDAPIFVVNTRWHEDDLVGHELQKMAHGKGDDWEVLNIPALAEEDDPLGREPGEGLWPELFGTAFYQSKKRTLTARSWNSLYMGKPSDEEGGVLRREQIHRYDNVPENEYRGGKLFRQIIRRVTLSVDCAEKATQRSDYTAATVWIETTDKKHYLVHAARTKKEFTEMVEWIEHIAKTWNVDEILVEDRGAGTQYIQVRKEGGGPAPVIAIATKQQSKEFRFDGVTPMFSAQEVLLPRSGNDWISDLEHELLAFPAGKNDDYVDSVSQYLAYKRENGVGRMGVRKMKSGVHA